MFRPSEIKEVFPMVWLILFFLCSVSGFYNISVNLRRLIIKLAEMANNKLWLDIHGNPLNRLSHTIYQKSNFNYRYVRLRDLHIFREKWLKLYANSGDPDQMAHSAASDLGLHCLSITFLWVSRLQWVNCL